jgi:hypothetical protein
VIEFERILPGDGTRTYLVSVGDIVSLEPAEDEQTHVRIRDHGEVIAQASYAKIRRLVSLARGRMASTLDPDS